MVKLKFDVNCRLCRKYEKDIRNEEQMEEMRTTKELTDDSNNSNDGYSEDEYYEHLRKLQYEAYESENEKLKKKCKWYISTVKKLIKDLEIDEQKICKKGSGYEDCLEIITDTIRTLKKVIYFTEE